MIYPPYDFLLSYHYWTSNIPPLHRHQRAHRGSRTYNGLTIVLTILCIFLVCSGSNPPQLIFVTFVIFEIPWSTKESNPQCSCLFKISSSHRHQHAQESRSHSGRQFVAQVRLEPTVEDNLLPMWDSNPRPQQKQCWNYDSEIHTTTKLPKLSQPTVWL